MKQNLLFNQASAFGMRFIMVLTMLIIVGVGQAWGETATFTATQSGGWTTNAGAQSGTIDGVTLAVTNGINNGTQLRCYANATMTISSTNNITKIVVTCTSTSNGPSNFSLSNSTGNYSYDGTTGTWEGSATSVSLNASAQVRMTQIDVTYESATPKQEYTLTYQSGETSGTLQVEEGANLLEALSVLETPVSCDATSTKFVGWTTTEITEKTNTEPTFLTDSDVMPSENYAVYAVFAREESVPGGTSWEKVTSSKTDWSGVYVLTASEYVLDYSTSSTAGNATKFSTAGLSVNDNTLTGVTDKYTVTIEKSGSYYTVSLNGKGYLTLASNSNTVSRTTSVTGNDQKWTISWADNTAHLYSVSYTSRELQKNNSNAYMRCYTGTQTDLTWYEQTSSYTTAYYDYITTCTTETFVTLHPNGGTISDVNGDWDLVDGLYKQTTTESNIVLPTITKGNWTFAGWDKDDDGETDYGATETITLNGTDVELSALWECTSLLAPIGLDAEPTSDGGRISWNQVTNATGYEISTDGGNTWGLSINGGSNTSHTLTNRECETPINWQVRAVGNTENGYCEENPAASHSFTTLECGCPSYAFHYGTNEQDNWNEICFEAVGDYDEMQIANFEIPSTTHYYVGKPGYNDNYGNRGQVDGPNSQTTTWDDMYLAMSLQSDNANGSPKLGQATGAVGTIRIFANSTWNNKQVAFIPDGYGVTFVEQAISYAFHKTTTDNKWETDALKLPDVANNKYTVGLATQTEGEYVASNHSNAAELINKMGVTEVVAGKKMIYFKPGPWNVDDAKFAIWDATNSIWGDGTTKLLTDADGDGVYGGYVASSCKKINLVRLSSTTTTSNIDWSLKWNQTGDITLSTDGLAQEYTITGWGENDYAVANATPKTGQNGKFRMWDNSTNKNWFVHFIPYYLLSYDANGGEGEMRATEYNTEDANNNVIVSANDFTRTGYDFVSWNTKSDGMGTSYAANATYTLSADATLYAQWQTQAYDITYMDQGNVAFSGENTTSLPATHTYGTATVVPDGVKKGYTFGGWYDNPDCTGTSINQLGATDYTSDITLYAKWTAKPIPTLVWKLNGTDITEHTVTIASESNVFPTLETTLVDLAEVEYSSSNTDVATIDDNGNIILKSAGNTTIRAYYVEGDIYADAEAAYTLKVKESTNCRWEEVTIDDIEYGDEVVIAMKTDAAIYAMSINDDDTATPEATIITPSNFATDNGIGVDLTWYIEKDVNGKLIIRPKKDITKNVYCNTSADNDRVRVGNRHSNHEQYKTFEIVGNYLKNSSVYYIGVNISKGQWWGYANNSNIPFQTLKFYKRVCLPEGQYWVKWMVNGQEYTEGNPTRMVVAGGQVVTLPTIPDNYQLPGCTSKKFIGWTTDEILVETDDAPTMFTDAASSPAINTNQTFHALFADVLSEPSETIILNESLSNGVPGTWTSSTAYNENGGVRLSSKNNGGTMKTPILSNLTSNAVLTFKILHYGSEDGIVSLSASTGTFSPESFTASSSVDTWTEETSILTGGNATTTITFTGTKEKRIYIKDILLKAVTEAEYENYVTQCCTPWEAPTLSATTSIAVGGSTTITHSGTTHGAVTYTPSNTDIATVDANGKVTGLKPGKVTITATWDGVDGVNNYCPAETTIDITVRGSFTITYDANDALASGNTESTVIEYPDGKGTVANNGFALDGHEFVKWNTAPDGSGYDYTEGASITLTDNLTLYAIWQPNQYDITVNVVGGSITLGTTTITTANTPQTITDVVAHGQSFSFTNAIPDAAYETPYAVTLESGMATVTSNSLTISNVQSDLEITIEYTLKPVYTITYIIPEGGGELAADAVTSIYKGGSITLLGIKDGTISSEYSCEQFIGWTTNPADYEAAGLKPEPFYNKDASFSNVSEDVTFYPVYSRPGAGVGGTVTLTEEEMYDWEDAGYGTSRDLTTCVGTWTTTGYKSGSHAIQLNSAYYIKFPELQGNITQVVLNATNGSDATLTSGTFILKTEGGTTIASASVNGSGICTIPVTGSYTTAYLYSSVTARITNIAITYGPPAIISTTLDCSSDVDECTITYDSNESFLINGASVYGSCTNSTFRFSEIGEYTICSNIRANQYVLVGWNNQCDGKGSLTYTPGQVITSLPQNNLTLYAQWAPVVSLNDAGSVSEVNATTFGGAVALPDGEKGCDPYEFVGWTTVYPSWNEESILPTIVDNPYTPTEPTTLYAVYAQRATSPDFTANCDGGVYKIWVNNSAKNYMAGRLSTYYFYTVEWWHDGCDKCEGSDGTPFTINKVGENTYTIQNADGHYITRHYSDDNKLAIETTWDNLDRYKWTISAGTNGSWRFTNKAATTYALVFYDKYFQLRAATNVTSGSSYYDLELTPVESAVYYSAPSCGPYSIHFYTHGGEFVQGEYAFSTAVTEGLTDPTETKFPSAELTGYTFVGWKENSPQDELTDNAPEDDTSAEPYGLKKPGDDLITTTRREYHAVYYYYDELQDIDFSAPFTTGMYAEDSNGDKHFVTGTPHDRYGGLATTTACGDISEVTITPGTGANVGKFTISINGYSIVPANTVDLIQGDCWWTIEETSEGSGEYKIAQDNEDDRRNIVLRNSTFNYYKETGSAPDFGYGDDVFYPKFGNCREHHWASEPQRKPSIVLGTSGSMTITSSVGQTVKAANKLFVGATNYEVQTKIYLSCNVEGVELLYEDGGALSSDAIGKYLTTTAEGELATTYLILTYTPTATTDGIETVTITAQDEEGTAKATRLAQVRHLPENFVIAAKTGNSWVALNANITSTGTQAAPLIMVDNIALPTKATITPHTTKYQLLGLQKDEPSIPNSRFKNNGAAVHLYSTNVSKVISASTLTDNNKTYINADATHESAAISPNYLFYEWQLQTNDLVHYTLVNSNTTNTSNTKLGYSATYAQWGMYQTGNNVIQEVLLLPIEKDITEMDVEVMEWGTNSMALRFGSEAPATVDITLGATSTKGLSLTNLNSGNISDIYKVEGLSLAGNDCEALLITDATDASKGKLIRKPILVSGDKKGSDYTIAPTRDVCMHSDIVILNGGKLVADEAKTVGSHVDFANIYVYPGGKLVLDGNSLGVKRHVYLRGGYSWLNSTYALPEVYVNGNINFNGSGNMIYDYYIQNQKYYQFALPYDVQLANVTDESGANNFPVWVKHYNGALRAADAYATSWEWYPSENGDANAYFKAGIGYIIAAKPRQVGNVANRPLSIIRFPLGNSAFTGGEGDKSVVTTAHGIDDYKAGTVTANNVGWNFIGNPFMATWKGDIGHKELAKYPDEDNWDGSYHWVDSDVKFITIMSPEDGSDYEQTIAANADLNPFFPFYLQETAEGGSGEIAFSSDKRIKKAPAMLLTEQPRETYVQIEITTDDATDQTGMFIGNQYSDNIDFDDYEKMFGTSTDKPKVWLVHDNTRLAFEAMTENRATGMTPLGYRAPQDGEYMLVLNDEVSKMGNIEAVYLTDHETGITDYDLTSSDYKFESTVTLYNDTRFTIRIVMRDNTQGSITGIENIVEMSEHTTKFIYQDKIYILHHGVIYDATGKRVITINK